MISPNELFICLTFVPDDIQTAIMEGGAVSKLIALLKSPNCEVCKAAELALVHLTQYGNLGCF
jgi:hypothetical protein